MSEGQKNCDTLVMKSIFLAIVVKSYNCLSLREMIFLEKKINLK